MMCHLAVGNIKEDPQSLDLILHNTVDWVEKMLTGFQLVQSMVGKNGRIVALMPL